MSVELSNDSFKVGCETKSWFTKIIFAANDFKIWSEYGIGVFENKICGKHEKTNKNGIKIVM